MPYYSLNLHVVSGRVIKCFFWTNEKNNPVILIKLANTKKQVMLMPLVLTPVTVREVERNLLLWARGRAGVRNHRRTTRPMRMLTRLVNTGHEVIASHILTILGGPMERMADWGDTRRRPCIMPIKVQIVINCHLGFAFSRDSVALGSVENYRCPVPYRIPG